MTPMPSPADVSPPRARVSPTRLETHGVVRVDDYYWMRERTEPEVLAYLEAENAHTKAVMAATEPLQETLFSEIKGRIKQTEMSVPYREGEYRYYTRYEDGLEYPIYCRCGLEESSTNWRKGTIFVRCLDGRSVLTVGSWPTRLILRAGAFIRSISSRWTMGDCLTMS